MSACVAYAVSTQDLLALQPAHETFVYNHWDHEETWKDIQAGKPGGMSLSIMTMLDPGARAARRAHHHRHGGRPVRHRQALGRGEGRLHR